MSEESVGIVETKYLHIDEPIELDCGKALKDVTIAYETYGDLNKDKSNAIPQRGHRQSMHDKLEWHLIFLY